MKRVDWQQTQSFLTQLLPGLWAQVLLLLCLAIGAHLVLELPFLAVTGPRSTYLSVLGNVFPSALWESTTVAKVARVGFLIAAVPWALRVGPSWVRWCAVAAFWIATSIYEESLSYVRHEPNVIACLLVLLAIPKSLNAPRKGMLRDPLRLRDNRAPRWLYLAALVYVVKIGRAHV